MTRRRETEQEKERKWPLMKKGVVVQTHAEERNEESKTKWLKVVTKLSQLMTKGTTKILKQEDKEEKEE